MKKTEVFIGSCSKYVDNQGWTTEIPTFQIKEKGYVNVKELKEAFWRYIGKNGTIINNGNIDYVVEQVLKENKL